MFENPEELAKNRWNKYFLKAVDQEQLNFIYNKLMVTTPKNLWTECAVFVFYFGVRY